MDSHLLEKVSGILVITLLEMLQFLVLIIFHHLILMRDILGINENIGAPDENLVLI